MLRRFPTNKAWRVDNWLSGKSLGSGLAQGLDVAYLEQVARWDSEGLPGTRCPFSGVF